MRLYNEGIKPHIDKELPTTFHENMKAIVGLQSCLGAGYGASSPQMSGFIYRWEFSFDKAEDSIQILNWVVQKLNEMTSHWEVIPKLVAAAQSHLIRTLPADLANDIHTVEASTGDCILFGVIAKGEKQYECHIWFALLDFSTKFKEILERMATADGYVNSNGTLQ